MYPALNPEVKCIWRWHRDQGDIARFSIQCREQGAEAACPDWALWTPENALPPFELWVPSGQSFVTSWKVYDLEGTQVADLAAEIPNIRVQLFVGRDYLIYDEATIGQTLPKGRYESILTVSGVQYFSETFQIMCAETTCFHRLEWSNCGSVGTQYYDDGFQNRYYIPQQRFLSSPSPDLNFDDEEARDGSQEETFGRKDVDWTLDLDRLPWFLLDALTEIPLHSDILFTRAGQTEASEVLKMTVDYDWQEDCVADISLVFRVDEATVVSSCCETFDPPCVSPCIEAVGFSDTEDPILGEIYLMVDSPRYATYLGFDNGPVDVNGFGPKTICASRLALAPSPDFGDLPVYFIFTGGIWFVLAEILEKVNLGSGLFEVSANIQGGYSAQLQTSSDQSMWTDAGEVHSADEWGGGVELALPEDQPFLRLVILGPDECTVATSPVFPCVGDNLVIATFNEFGSLAGIFFNSSVWKVAPSFAELPSGDEEGQFGFAQDTGTFYQWDGDSWETVAEELWPVSMTEDGMCFAPLTAHLEIQWPLASPFIEAGGTYQILYTIAGTGTGAFYLLSECAFDGAGDYECFRTAPFLLSSINGDLDIGFSGCISLLTVRKVCG